MRPGENGRKLLNFAETHMENPQTDMKIRIVSTLLAMFLVAGVWAQGFKAHSGDVPGAYNFWFYNPEAQVSKDSHFPLLIFLHGASLCGRNLNKVKRYGAIDAVSRGRYIDSYIVAPQNPGGAWNPEKIMKIVEWAERNYNVDTTRIYVYGMSLGGFGTIDFAATYPDKVACAMALCGGGTVRDLSGLSKVPLWIVHGTADRAVSVSASDKVVAAIRDTGDDSRLIYTRMPGVNHGRPARIFYMLQTYDWMFSHSIADKDRPVNREFEITNEMLSRAYQDLGKDIDFGDDY